MKKSSIVSNRVIKQASKTNIEYGLIKENDRILIALSGGKDSLSMVHTLLHMQRVSPIKFTIEAVTISYGMGEDYSKIKSHLKPIGIKYNIVDTKIYEISKEKIRDNSSFCSFYSRMRRGALYTYALENGFNKLALGHHLDDAIETFFMGFLYNGVMRTMPPMYEAQNGLIIIRPLIEIREKQLQYISLKNSFPAIGNEYCPSFNLDLNNIKTPYARMDMKSILSDMEVNYPLMFKSINNAFKNIHIDTFFTKN